MMHIVNSVTPEVCEIDSAEKNECTAAKGGDDIDASSDQQLRARQKQTQSATSGANNPPLISLALMEEFLEERQLPDRRVNSQSIDFADRRKSVRRRSDHVPAIVR